MSSNASERDKAEWDSKTCQLCGGSGLPVVYHREWSGGRFALVATFAPDGSPTHEQIPAEVGAHCICPVGRWLRANTDRRILDRIPDGAAIVAGRSNWSFEPPIEPATVITHHWKKRGWLGDDRHRAPRGR